MPDTNESGMSEEVRVALHEILGSYEALARILVVQDSTRSLNEIMNWDGPICARRVLGRPAKWKTRDV